MMQMYFSSYTTPLDGSSLMRAITGHSGLRGTLKSLFQILFLQGEGFCGHPLLSLPWLLPSHSGQKWRASLSLRETKASNPCSR